MVVGICLLALLSCYLIITVYSVGKENTELVKENEYLTQRVNELDELQVNQWKQSPRIPCQYLDVFEDTLYDFMRDEKQNIGQTPYLLSVFEDNQEVTVRIFNRAVDFQRINRTFGNLNFLHYEVVDYSSEKGESFSIKFLYKNQKK